MTTLAFGNSWKICLNRPLRLLERSITARLLETALRLQPDVIITDISMPILSGIEAAKRLKESGSRAKLVFLTVHSDPDIVRACLNAGASGYVVKPRMDTDLVPAVREALASRIFLSPTGDQQN
jgi:DNA-binding NarL/FixJ family response regulator